MQSSTVAQVSQSKEPQDRIAELTLTTDGLRAVQPCPAIIRFRGTMAWLTGPEARYRWRRSDGRTTPYSTVRLNGQESRDLFHLERVGQRGDKSVSGWLELEVQDGGGLKTARANFAITCRQDESRGVSPHVSLQTTGREGEEVEENPLERFESLFLKPRGYTLKDPFDNRRIIAYERLRQMRRLQGKPHRPVGWRSTAGAGVTGTVDANNCAWSSIGPTNIQGRVTQIAIDPTNNQRLFASTIGGLWRSTDGARRWQRVSDDFLATTFASVAINPANPAEVFAGTGDPNRHGSWGSGYGIWRSTANGDPGSWSKVSSDLDGHVIYRLRIDPDEPHDVYAATSKGVYIGTRSADGSITFALLNGFDAWTNDIVVDFSATRPLVYAGVRTQNASFARGVWKYDGTTWSHRNTGIPPANSPSPRTIGLALAQSNPSVLYAIVEGDLGQQVVYKTTSGGETSVAGGNAWTATSLTVNDNERGWASYNSVVEVDPANVDIVWATSGIGLRRTTTGGDDWVNIGAGADPAFPLGLHADHHAIAFDPTNSKIVYDGNDGGIFRSGDTSAGTWRWNNVSHNMVITEYFRVTSQQTLAGIAAGGAQDNGTVITFGNRTWYKPGEGDGFVVAFDAANASTLYASANGRVQELTNPVPGTAGGGSEVTFTVPSGVRLIRPLVSDSVVVGAALAAGFISSGGSNPWRLLKTTDGLNWNDAGAELPNPNSFITAIGIAPSSNFQTYYIGFAEQIWRTTNGGSDWSQTSSGLPATNIINMITVDTTNPARAIAATSNGIFLTTDTGATWSSLQGTNPNALPTTAITGAVFDPNDPNGVFATTEVAVYRGTIDPGSPTATWTPFDEGLPDGVDISDIWVNYTKGILKIATKGHGAFQRDVRPGITCPSARLVVRDNVNDYGVEPSPSGVPDPEHPIPDPARPGFYKPDDTHAGMLRWWKSTDVRIDVPSSAPPKNQIANADHVEMQTCPINLVECPPGSVRDMNPQRGQTAKVYAQVTNTGLQPGTNVRVVALYAAASAGLPNLPADFWTTTFPAGSTTCGALDTTSGWRFADPSNPCPVIGVVNPDVPEVVSYNWTVPLDQAEHSCMLIISESESDPLDPGIRSTNERRITRLVPNHRQISLRNLHVVNEPLAAARSLRPRPRFESMSVSNPSESADKVELVFSSVDFPPDALLGVFLPPNTGVGLKGVQRTSLELTDAQLERARQLNLDTGTFYRVIDPLEATIELPIPPGQTWRIGVAYSPGELEEGVTARWSVLARQGAEVLGGNTYYIRPDPSLVSTPASRFFSLGARAGVAIPHSPFSSFFDPHIAATVDLEYHFTNQFSVAGGFGYRRFSGPFSSDLNIYQFAGGPKFYLTGGAVRPFVNGGVGSFTFDSGTTKFGVYGGTGLQFRVWPRVWLEGEYVYHNVFTSGSNLKYSTVQGGIRFRF